MFDNLLLLTDSYKTSHFNQFATNTSFIYSYIEARGGIFPTVTLYGLQYLLKRYLEGIVVTQEKIDQAEIMLKIHGVPFNKEGWQYILEKYNGKLPIRIKSIPEGLTVPTGNILASIENTDSNCYWLPSYLETILIQNLWYGSSICTLSRQIKKTIKHFLEKTGDIAGLDFKLHDFGFRGVSSIESSAIGGSAHLVNFKGTDTLSALSLITQYYNEKDPQAYSIPASEHSTITSWGKGNELAAFENMLDKYPTGLVACVSDSYNIYHALESYWGTALKEKVLKRNGTTILRLDSGEPIAGVCDALEILHRKFGYTTNSKGYTVLPPQVRILQGDGVNKDSIKAILEAMEMRKYSADNIAFGMGGGLLSSMTRDSLSFAQKCSAAQVNGQWRDVYKEPIGSPDKQSKRGKLALVNTVAGYKTVKSEYDSEDILRTVFENGELLINDNFSTIRQRASL